MLSLQLNARGSGLRLVITGGHPLGFAFVLAGAARQASAQSLEDMAQGDPVVVVPVGSFDAAGMAFLELEPLTQALRGRPLRLQAASLGSPSGPLWLSARIVAGQLGQDGMRPPAPSGWCWTQQQHLASLKRGAVGPLAECAVLGPCDNAINRDAAIPTPATPIKTYRLSIHVFCESGGSNCAATAADVAVAVARLNTDYAPLRIQFEYDSNFINSTTYRYLDVNAETSGMKNSYASSPATKLNVYVVSTGGGSWGTFPWSANALGKQGGIVMHEAGFGASTSVPNVLTHEVGHCLGLWHTFHGVTEVTQCSDCYEAAGRSTASGDATGDRCSDTNPTTSHSACGDPAGLDPCSSNPWLATPWLNYMGYSITCSSSFTAQQAGRMHCWTMSKLTGWLVVPAAPGTPVLSKVGGGQIQIAWADNSSSEDGFRVQREKKSGPWGSAQIVATVGANTTLATDSPGSGKFRYRVQAFNGSGSSAWSAWAQIAN